MLSLSFLMRFLFVTPFFFLTLGKLTPRPSHLESLYRKHLESRQNGKHLQRRDSIRRSENPQAPLVLSSSVKSTNFGENGTAVLEIERYDMFDWNYPDDLFGFPIYFVTIGLGNPPQPFKLLLQLDYGGVAVRSVDCPGEAFEGCGSRIFTYNHSASSTSQDMKLRFGVNMDGRVRGSLFRDSMNVPLPVQNATVGATDDIRFSDWDWVLPIVTELCDGALGLAPPNSSSMAYYDGWKHGVKSHPNFLYELMESGVLAHKTMTLSLPKNVDQLGSLVFGKEPPLAKHLIPLIRGPIPNEMDEGWIVNLTRIQFNFPGPFDILLHVSAAITLDSWFTLGVPHDLANAIYKYLGVRRFEDPSEGALVDCELRKSLPDLILTLGDHPITLTWEDYTAAWPSVFLSPPFCKVEIIGLYFEEKTAILGQKAWRKFNVSFDMERDEIALIAP